MSAEEIANAFVAHYYQTFDSNVEQLQSLFVRRSYCVLHCCALCLRCSLVCRAHSLFIVVLLPFQQQPTSMMTFEGQPFQGAEAIVGKLRSVGQVKHTVKSTDIQPSLSGATGPAILIFVTGGVQIGGDNPLHYCEMFQLVPTGAQQPGSYYVHNCVFRLNYGM